MPEAWSRSVPVIRDQLIPIASGFRVQIGIEEVWNKFLLSPLEFNRYVDEFQSPTVKAYFDVGNVVFYGYPQDWIRTLGRRIARLHLKDFKVDRDAGTFEWKNLGEGDIDWVEVRKAPRRGAQRHVADHRDRRRRPRLPHRCAAARRPLPGGLPAHRCVTGVGPP